MARETTVRRCRQCGARLLTGDWHGKSRRNCVSEGELAAILAALLLVALAIAVAMLQ